MPAQAQKRLYTDAQPCRAGCPMGCTPGPR